MFVPGFLFSTNHKNRMKKLHIDIETRCSIDLKKSSVYKYVESPDFEILLFAYSIDGAPVQIIDLKNGDRMPGSILLALMDERIEKHAFNAQFERLCIDRHFKMQTPIRSWHCTAVLAASHGLPASLKLCAAALKLETQKLRSGETLIRKFSFIHPERLAVFVGPEWEQFKTYCIGDVVVEQAVADALRHLPTAPLFERDSYILDQQINDRGVAVDLPFARTCVELDDTNSEELEAEARELTGLENPNSDAQMKRFLSDELGTPITSLNKKDIDDIDVSGSDLARRAIELRKETRRSSTTKYRTMLRVANKDERLRGMFKFYGAARTGRWSGKIVQLHNMPAEDFPMLDLAKRGVSLGDLDLLRMTQDSVSTTLAALIRTAIIAKPKHLLACADYKAIEARIISWLAGEAWRMEIFAGHGMIYEASASAMFGVPIESIAYLNAAGEKIKGENFYLRKKGKISELACGYGGGVNAMINMGALREGLIETELDGIKVRWRAANPRIVALWKRIGNAAIAAVKSGNIIEVEPYGLRFACRESQGRKWLYIKLPSGRNLAYFSPIVIQTARGEELSYMKYGNDDGLSAGAAAGAVRTRTYGAKLVENIVQAIARDCLAVGLWRCEKAGCPTVLHVHDEIVSEVPIEIAPAALNKMLNLMEQEISWAPGLLLGGDGFCTPFYRKEQ